MGFRQRFAKKPALNALRPQFCSDDGSLPVELLPFCFSRQLPGLVCSEGRLRRPRWAHLGRESFCSMPAGRPPKRALLFLSPKQQPPKKGMRRVRARAGLQHHHPPPIVDLRPTHSWPHMWVCRVRGARGTGREGQGSKGQGCPPPRKIPTAWCIAEPWGQAWLWGIKGHPAHRGPEPGDTHHTEP